MTKSSTVALTASQPAIRVVSDFGCAMLGGGVQTRSSGTPAFLAPEMMVPNARYRCATASGSLHIHIQGDLRSFHGSASAGLAAAGGD